MKLTEMDSADFTKEILTKLTALDSEGLPSVILTKLTAQVSEGLQSVLLVPKRTLMKLIALVLEVFPEHIKVT